MKTILLLAAVVVLAACGGKKAPQELKIEIPKIPEPLTQPQQKAEFMAEHYWDNMPFVDTAYIDKEITLQTFSNYAYMLTMGLPLELALHSIDHTMNRAKVDSAMYAYFAKMSEDHFFDDPNSPYRNDAIYIAVLENILAWDGADELHKVRPRAQLALARQNMVGQAANPFSITLADGRQLPLYDVQAEYTLLYFANPDCPVCAKLTDSLKVSPTVQRLLKGGRMKVVTVYTQSDLDLWRSHITNAMPAEWTNGYALDFNKEQLYDLRAIPSMYLLDRDKKVLLKDAMESAAIDKYFENH